MNANMQDGTVRRRRQSVPGSGDFFYLEAHPGGSRLPFHIALDADGVILGRNDAQDEPVVVRIPWDDIQALLETMGLQVGGLPTPAGPEGA